MRGTKMTLAQRSMTAMLCLTTAIVAVGQCEVGKLTPSDGAADDRFGFSVAVDRQVAVIGAYGDDDLGGGAGAVYVFERLGAAWLEVAKLTAADGAAGDLFGGSVGISGDLIVIGAFEDDDAGARSGSAYVFERAHDGNWLQVAKLLADDGDSYDLFGYAAAIHANVIVIGAPEDEDQGYDSGSAYVFERDADGNWLQVVKLLPDDGDYGDRFGDAVAIDGDVIVIGAQDDEDLGNWSGSAYVFERDERADWIQVGKLLGDDVGVFDSFGASVAVSSDFALVGAPRQDGVEQYTGAAYVFQRSIEGAWEQLAKVFADDGENSDGFGCSVSIAGHVAVIGARYDDDDGLHSGSAYVFARQGDATWSQVAKLTASDAAPDDWFGEAVSLSGNSAVIGAWGNDDYGPKSGAAYMFAVGADEDGDGVMDACQCPGDLNHDWIVDYYDLAVLLADWDCDDAHNGCPGDCDRDGDTDHADLGLLLAYWGEICP
jgi:hypothetical protein